MHHMHTKGKEGKGGRTTAAAALISSEHCTWRRPRSRLSEQKEATISNLLINAYSDKKSSTNDPEGMNSPFMLLLF